ncbi:MAG: amidohydrolase family protein [Phycisphaerales bacterium]
MNGTLLSWRPAAAVLASVASILVGAAAVADAGKSDTARRPGPLAPIQPDPLAPPANGPRKADPTWHALINATVYPEPGKKFENATIVIRDGRILSIDGTPAGIAPNELRGVEPKKADADKPASSASSEPRPESTSPAPPPGARVWDCRGLSIYAGWVDPYVEVDSPAPASDAPGQHWNSRVTPQRSALDGQGVDAGTADSLRKIGFVAAGISPRGGIFRGSSAVVSLAKPDDDRQLARPPVYPSMPYQTVAFETGGRRGGGSDGNTNSNWSSYPDSQMGAIALIRQTLSDADWWQQLPPPDRQPQTGSQSEVPSCLDALRRSGAPGAPSGPMLLFDTGDELEVFRALKIADEFNRSVSILGCGNEFRRIDGITERCKRTTGGNGSAFTHNTPLIIPLNFPEPPKVGTLGQADAVDLRDLMTWEQAPTNPRRLDAAGLNVSLTTSRLRDRAKFTDNLRKAILHGLGEETALAMVTTRPASFLGVSSDLGTIAPGKVASLIVADGPIFSKKTKIRDVWVDGKRHEINPPPPTNLKGEWNLSLDPMPPQAQGVASMRITLSIDQDNNITIRKYTTKADGSEDVAKQTARNVRVEGTGGSGRISFVFDHEPFGDPGVFLHAGVIEDAGRTIHADAARSDGQRFRWTATKAADEPLSDADAAPKTFTGTWIYSEADGAAVDPAAVEAALVPTIVIDKDNNLTVRLKDKEVKADSAKVQGKTITIVIQGEPFGEPGVLNSTGTLDGDTITGQTRHDDGRVQTWKLSRKKDSPKQPDKKEPGKDGAAKPDAPADPVTGTWSGTATAQGTPQGIPVSFSLKLAGEAVSGTATAMGDTLPVESASFTKTGESAGKLKFRVTPPQGVPVEIDLSIDGNAATGTALAGPTPMQIALTRVSAGAGPTTDNDDDVPTDIPEKIAYPFGPFAMADGLPAVEDVVFEHATIWTCGPLGVIADGSMRIKDGVILWIADNSKPGAYKVEPGTRVIDCTGKHITPGLIDCHSHTGISRGVNESGQAVTAEVRIQDVTDPDSMSWYYQLAGGITTVNNLHGSANPIGGQNCVNKNRWGAVKPDDLHFEGAIPGIKFALGENVKQSNWGDGATTRYPKTRMGVEMLIRDRFTAAREYIEATKGRSHGATKGEANAALALEVRGSPSPRRDLELEALAEILEEKRLIHCHSYRQDEILMLCRVAKDFGFKLGTFQHILEGYKVADEVRDNSGGGSAFSDWWAYKVEVQDAIPYAGAIMHDVGVCVSFNSDSDELARRMNVEAGKAVKYGDIDPAEALKFVTLNPARQLRIDDKVGSLEPGKSADIAVWSVPTVSASSSSSSSTRSSGAGVPPASSPSSLSSTSPTHHTVDGTPMSVFARCEQTWVDGRLYFSAERDTQMRQANAKERARLIQKLLASGNKKPGQAKPGDPNSPGGPPGPPGRRGGRRPTDDLASGSAFDDAGASLDDAAAPSPDAALSDSARARLSLLGRMRQQADEARREYFLQLWRRGVDPTWARCGDCGEAMGAR